MYMSGLLLSDPDETRQQLTMRSVNELQSLSSSAMDNIKFALFSQDDLSEKIQQDFLNTDNQALSKFISRSKNPETNSSSNLLEPNFYDTFNNAESSFEFHFNDYLTNRLGSLKSVGFDGLGDSASYAITRLQAADFKSALYDQATVISYLSNMVDPNKDKSKILSLLQNQRLHYQHHQIIAANLPNGEIKDQYQYAVDKMVVASPEPSAEPQNKRLRR